VRRFKTIAELRQVPLAFPEIHNDTRLIERQGFLSEVTRFLICLWL
jgi:hypothetical protein